MQHLAPRRNPELSNSHLMALDEDSLLYVSREYGADSLLVSCWVSPPITDDRCPPAAERGLDHWLDVLQPAPIPSGLHPPAPLSGRPACRILRALQELTAPPLLPADLQSAAGAGAR